MNATRRGAIAGGVAAAILAVAGAWKLHLFGRRYPKTAYDDLLDQITDRAPASAFGKSVLKTHTGLTPESIAATLRRPGFALQSRAKDDPAAGRVMEVDGWVVPQSVALYAALAARF